MTMSDLLSSPRKNVFELDVNDLKQIHMQNINAGHLTFLLAVRHDVVLIILFFLKHAKNECKLAYFTWQTNVGAHADAAGSGNERDSKKSGENRKKTNKQKPGKGSAAENRFRIHKSSVFVFFVLGRTVLAIG